MRILIGIPTFEGQKYCVEEFLQSLAALKHPTEDVLFADNSPTEGYARSLRSKSWRVIWNPPTTDGFTSKIIENRNVLIKAALDGKYDAVLFLDSDTMAPPDTIALLTEDFQTRNAAVAAGVVLTEQNLDGTMRLWPNVRIAVGPEQVAPLPVEIAEKGRILRVAAVGFGCALIKTELLRDIPLRLNDAKTGEDFNFCYDAAKWGYVVIADCRVKCAHVKQEARYEFKERKEEGFSLRYNGA